MVVLLLWPVLSINRNEIVEIVGNDTEETAEQKGHCCAGMILLRMDSVFIIGNIPLIFYPQILLHITIEISLEIQRIHQEISNQLNTNLIWH